MKRIYPLKHEDFFSIIDTPVKAYYLGLISSDGCLYNKHGKGSNLIRISLQIEDEYILSKFAREIGTSKPITYTNGKYANFEISSNKMYDDLVSLGLSPRKTYGETIPNVSDILMKYFIRGYMDGDGCITHHEDVNKTNISISGYKNNLMKIHDYLENRNIITSFTEDKRFYLKGNGAFGSLVLTNNIAKYAFVRHIYEDDDYPVLIRKKKLADQLRNKIELEQENKPLYKTAIIYYKYAVQKVS